MNKITNENAYSYELSREDIDYYIVAENIYSKNVINVRYAKSWSKHVTSQGKTSLIEGDRCIFTRHMDEIPENWLEGAELKLSITFEKGCKKPRISRMCHMIKEVKKIREMRPKFDNKGLYMGSDEFETTTTTFLKNKPEVVEKRIGFHVFEGDPEPLTSVIFGQAEKDRERRKLIQKELFTKFDFSPRDGKYELWAVPAFVNGIHVGAILEINNPQKVRYDGEPYSLYVLSVNDFNNLPG